MCFAGMRQWSGGGLGVLLSKMFKGKLSGLEDLLHYFLKCTFAVALRNKCLSPAREGMWAAAGTWLPPAWGGISKAPLCKQRRKGGHAARAAAAG